VYCQYKKRAKVGELLILLALVSQREPPVLDRNFLFTYRTNALTFLLDSPKTIVNIGSPIDFVSVLVDA
jgi:hypothetical protein